MTQISYSLQVRFKPSRAWYRLGPGWALLAGIFSSRELDAALINTGLDPWIYIGMLWFLVDPLLGTLQDLWIQRDRWLQGEAGSLPLQRSGPIRLPYVTASSPAFRLNTWFGRLLQAPHGEGHTLLWGGGLALVLAFVLGPLTVAYLSLIGLISLPLRSQSPPLLQMASNFLLPFLLGRLLYSTIDLVSVLMALVFSCLVYGGLQLSLENEFGRHLRVGGLGAATCLVFALNQPVLGALLALVTILCYLTWLSVAGPAEQPGAYPAYVGQTGIFVWLGLVVTTVALRGI